MTLPTRPARATALTATALLAGAALLWLRRARRRPVSWRGRVAIVTGGARGLGFELARQLADDGVVVWLVSRTATELERAVDLLGQSGAAVYAHAADVTSAEQMADLVATVVARHGRLDVVVNNAGVITAMPFRNAEIADFEESLATHFWGPLHLVRAALPWLRQARPGHVINISSIGGRVGVPHLAPYCAGKFALSGLSQVLRAELAADDVWVTLATPGLMRTGSIGRVRVRGAHVAEARWFAALSATRLTSTDPRAAARHILDAARRGRFSVTPGWQARAQAAASAVAPESTTAALAAVSTHVLPAPVAGASPARPVDSLDLGWAAALISETTKAAYNQR